FIICLFTFLCSSFFLAPPTTEFYPLSLHDALPIFDLVTVLAPVNAPSGGYVVYEDTRRAAAGRRLNRTLDSLHEAGISAHGLVVDTSPVDAVKDALAQLDPRPDRIVVSTHPEEKSGWLRKNMVDRIREAAGSTP